MRLANSYPELIVKQPGALGGEPRGAVISTRDTWLASCRSLFALSQRSGAPILAVWTAAPRRARTAVTASRISSNAVAKRSTAGTSGPE
jgi:hypothetical protein